MRVFSHLHNTIPSFLYRGFPRPDAPQYHNRHGYDVALWHAAIVAGLYPQVAYRRRGDLKFTTMNGREANIHAGSVNAMKGQRLSRKCKMKKGAMEYIVFGEIVKGSSENYTVSQTTRILSPLPLLLLCGKTLQVERKSSSKSECILKVDDGISFRCNESTAMQIVVLRKRLESAFWTFLLDPSAGLSNLSPSDLGAVEILGKIFRDAHSIHKKDSK